MESGAYCYYHSKGEIIKMEMNEKKNCCGHINNGINAVGSALHFNDLCVCVRCLVGCGLGCGVDNDGVLSCSATAHHNGKCINAAGFCKEAYACHIHNNATCIKVAVDLIVCTAVQTYEGIFTAPTGTHDGKTCLAVNGILRKCGNKCLIHGRIEDNIKGTYTLCATQKLLATNIRIRRVVVLLAQPEHHGAVGRKCRTVVEIPHAV